ncbi:MAG: SUF system NifU family Fe-S cluster assembly protein [Chloroflexota bacterium]
MSTLYTEIIQDAYRHPRHRGDLAHPTYSHEDENPLCGDMLRVQLRIEDGHIAEAMFQGHGCVISQAAAELVLDLVHHQPLSVIHDLDKTVVLEELGLPAIAPARLKCALLCVEVLKRAVSDRHASP